MRRYGLATAVLAALGLLALPNIACEDPTGGDKQALHINGNTFVSSRTQCQIRAGATEFRPRGYMDIAVTNTYFLYPQVENLLPETDDLTTLGPAELRLNNNNLTIIGATVNYDYDDTSGFGEQGGTFYFDDFQGVFVRASGSAKVGEIAPTVIQAVPYELGNLIAGDQDLRALGGAGVEITLRVRVVGQMADGTQVQSNELWYPLVICNGCLVYFPPNVDPRVLLESITVPCVPGQDDGVDTRLCYAYASAPGANAEALNRARDRCRWQHILLSIEPPDSQEYWDIYGPTFFPERDRPCGLNGVDCR